MTEEFKLAKEICEKILANKLEWKDLFEPMNFFGKYTHFIAIICSDQAEWVGLLESKIRLLVQQLERQPAIKLVHLNPNSFDNLLDDSQRTLWFIGLDLDKHKGLNIDLTVDIANFVANVKNTAINSFKNHSDEMSIDIRHVRRKDLHMYLNEKDHKKIVKEKQPKDKTKRKTDDNTISSKRAKIDSSNGSSNSKSEETNLAEESNKSIDDDANQQVNDVELKSQEPEIPSTEIPFLETSMEDTPVA